MPTADDRLVTMMRAVIGAMERNVRSLADADHALRRALKRSRRSVHAMAGAACPGLPDERGTVVVTLASPARIAIMKLHGEGIVEDAVGPAAWLTHMPPAAATSADPVEDPEIRGDLAHRFAIEAVRGLMADQGSSAGRILSGWTIVTGIAAWDGRELAIKHACSLIEAEPIH